VPAAVTLTITEACTVLEPPMTAVQLRAIVTALGWPADDVRHTGRAGRPTPAYNATRLIGLHAALTPYMTSTRE